MKRILSCLFIFFGIFSPGSSSASDRFPSYTLSVSFDIPHNTLRGVAEIALPEGEEILIGTDTLDIISVKIDGQPLMPDIDQGKFVVKGGGILEIVYSAVYAPNTTGQEGPPENHVSEKGVSLIRTWYPAISTMSFYRLKALMPEGYSAISESDEVEALKLPEGTEYTFIFPYPASQIHLIGTAYEEIRDVAGDIEIYGYFPPAHAAVGDRLMKLAKAELNVYSELLSPYPFKRFTIVEHFLPGEHSIPSCVITGQDLEDTISDVAGFRRRILEQWFGNFIYASSSQGNWTEGLTSYLAKYYRNDTDSWVDRKNIIITYENTVSPEMEKALIDIEGTSLSSQTIFSGKGVMFFHMLKNLLGEGNFIDGLKRFVLGSALREVSWGDLRVAFEESSGKDLEGFWEQWVSRKGMPSLLIESPSVKYKSGVPTVSFDIVQEGTPYELALSGYIRTSEEDYPLALSILKRRETFEFAVRGRPLELVLDPGYDTMRTLSDDEHPPVLSALFGDEEKIFVLARDEQEKSPGFSALLQQNGFRVVEDSELKDEDIKRSSLLTIGLDSPLIRRLFGSWTEKDRAGFHLMTRKNPLNRSKIIAVAYADQEQTLEQMMRRVFVYGEYSTVSFDSNGKVEKGVYETDQGLTRSLSQEVLVVEPTKANDLDRIIEKIIDTPVIYIGERHPRYEDHKVQLQVIMRLHEQGRKFAIGMEMFQKPFQTHIDKYLEGTITDREFLKKTEYFKRWQFDYNYYREILEYARANKIPVVALNLWTEIIRKVASEGLDNLTEIEKGELPPDMDMSDDDYRDMLLEIFHQHPHQESRDFDYFYQSQILWDETMAHTVHDYLQKRPDCQFVVLAGVGHVMYGAGIPKRLKRLNGRDYITLIPDIGEFDKNLGDFVYVAEEIPSPPTLKLGVVLKEFSGRVQVEKIVPRSIAKDLGIQEGDIIISLDDWNIEDINDVKIFMSGSSRGQEISVRILRKRFLAGYEEKVLSGTF